LYWSCIQGDFQTAERTRYRVTIRGLFRIVKTLLCSGAKAVRKEALKTGSNILRDLLQKQPDQQVGEILKSRFDEVKDNLEHKRKKITGSSLGLKTKHSLKRLVLNVNARRIFSQKKMECLKPALVIFLKQSIQTCVVNSNSNPD
jgi:hypothetical protein